MSRSKVFILVGIAVVVGTVFATVAVISYAIHPFNDLRVYEPAPFATAAEAAKGCAMPIPAEAKNTRYAEWTEWISQEKYLRFEAPLSVCLEHAAVLVPNAPLAPIAADQLVDDARPMQPGIFRDLSWFDLGRAQNVVGSGGGSQAQVWVDQSRGVLYYHLTD